MLCCHFMHLVFPICYIYRFTTFIFNGCYVSQETCNNPAIYITENGFSQIGPVEFEDIDRCQFYQDTLQQVSKGLAIAVYFMLFTCSNKSIKYLVHFSANVDESKINRSTYFFFRLICFHTLDAAPFIVF